MGEGSELAGVLVPVTEQVLRTPLMAAKDQDMLVTDRPEVGDGTVLASAGAVVAGEDAVVFGESAAAVDLLFDAEIECSLTDRRRGPTVKRVCRNRAA